ncbi:MAG: FtsX-like permease family protein [Pedobacter sp.]|nr:MAG: FtsX-like permease family protein [Pedobacter sp.]
MSPIQISWKSIWSKPLSAGLNILLIAFGTAILSILLLASKQIEAKLENNAKDIDLVVGAKGSPLQLILSSIYYIDFPTGNIPLKDAKELMANPFVKRAVPLALGDNYEGTRIVGTDSTYIGLYGLSILEGKFWEKDLEATIGAEVAKSLNLKVGDTFNGSHGLTETKDVHKHLDYKVVGILKPSNNVTDHLILTSIRSIWKMHGDESQSTQAKSNHMEDPDEYVDHAAHTKDADHTDATAAVVMEDDSDKELTSLLIQYRSPMSVAMFPRMVNQMTSLQSASPAMESTRLFSLIGVGVDTLEWFAILIMAIAGISVFVNLFNSLKERRYDLALMRIMGGSRGKLFTIVILEGLILTFVGALLGIFLGHTTLEAIAHYQDSDQAKLTGQLFIKEEIYIVLLGIAIGIIASIIPAIQAYKANIARILSKN